MSDRITHFIFKYEDPTSCDIQKLGVGTIFYIFWKMSLMFAKAEFNWLKNTVKFFFFLFVYI